MKRTLLLPLAAVVLIACAGAELTDRDRTPTLGAPVSPSPSAALPEDATTAARVRARGSLVVGIRYDLQPFGYVNESGEPAGFDVDLGREFAHRWLGTPQAARFRQVRSDTAIEHLAARDVDIIIAAFTHTQEREAGADFSLSYFVDGQALLVRAADAAAISSPVSLGGRPVGVVTWGDAAQALQAAVEFTPTIQVYDRFDEAVEVLGWGGVDAVADLRRRLFWGRRILPETTIVGQYTATPVAIAYPENDPYFTDLVNLTFQEMVTDGTYGELYARWFGPEMPPAVERWPGAEVPTLADAPVTDSVPDTIGAIQARGRLVVALVPDRPAFAHVDAAGVPRGYEVSLVQQMAARWLGDATAVDFITVTLGIGKGTLHTGEADILIGGLAHTRAAEMELDFSQTTYVAGEGLLVQAGTTITDVTSLDGLQVAAVEGSGSQQVLLAAARGANVSLTVLPQPTLEAAITLLEEGHVAAVSGDRADLLGPAYARPGLGVLALRLTQVPLALGLPPGDSTFRDLINLTLQTMKTEGQLDSIYAAWFDEAPAPLEVWPGTPYQPLSLR